MIARDLVRQSEGELHFHYLCTEHGSHHCMFVEALGGFPLMVEHFRELEFEQRLGCGCGIEPPPIDTMIAAFELQAPQLRSHQHGANGRFHAHEMKGAHRWQDGTSL